MYRALKSSNLAGMDYDPQTQSLAITFQSGDTYRYSDVPEGVAQALASAPSPGKYFHAAIRNTYDYEQE